MRIDCEVHAFRLKSRQAAPIIDGSVERLEGAARESKITALVLVQPAFLNDDRGRALRPGEPGPDAGEAHFASHATVDARGAGGVGSIRRRGFDANPHRSRSTGRIP